MGNSNTVFEQSVVISNKLGLHARPAALLVKTANKYKSEIDIIKVSDGEVVNAKSIMGVMMLAASQGTKLVIRADGDDSRDAAQALVEIIINKFGEE